MALNARNTKWYAFAFGAASILMLAGSGLFLYGILEERASQQWPHTQGSVTESFSERTCGSRASQSWEARIAYRYTVAGIEHRGQRVAGTPMYCDRQRDGVTTWLETHYPVGRQVEVYYNPEDPDAAFLHPGVVNIIEKVMVFACAIMSMLMAFGFLLARKARRQNSID